MCGRDSNVSHYFFSKLEFRIGDFNVSVTFFEQLGSLFKFSLKWSEAKMCLVILKNTGNRTKDYYLS